MTEAAAPTTKADAIELERDEAEQRKRGLQEEISALEDYIGWLDQGVELARALDQRPAELPPPPSEAESTKPPPRKKRGRKPAVKTKPESSPRGMSGVKAEAYARRDRLEAWLLANAGQHSPGAIREALGYQRQDQLNLDMTGLRKAGRAAVHGTGRGATYSAPGPSSNGAAASQPSSAKKPDPKPQPSKAPPAPAVEERPGPEGEIEAEIYDALRERALTVSALSIKTKRSANDLAPICFRMWKRDVLDRLDEKDPPVRYAVPN